MPPHCDSLDGPVVTAARAAIDHHDVDRVLPFVPEASEDEVRQAFQLASRARAKGDEARELADRYFFETVVRVHRAGEGAPYTGLKPAGLDVGPVIPVAEAAIESGSPDDLAELLANAVRDETTARFRAMTEAKASAGESVAAARRYVEAMLGVQVWAHQLYHAVHAPAHEHDHDHDHDHAS
jgi:hypothetical protein